MKNNDATPPIEGGSSGPLSPFIPRYMALIQSQGYSQQARHNQLAILERFNDWLVRRRLALGQINAELVTDFLAPLKKARWMHLTAPSTMRRLLGVLRADGVVPAEIKTFTAIDQVAMQFERFLVVERAVKPCTAVSSISFVRRLLGEKFKDKQVELERLSATDVIAFIQRHARSYGSSYAHKLVGSTRSFLRYLHYKGLHSQDLSTVVPKVARWKLSELPKYLTADQVKQVLNACDHTTPSGRRNHTILLLLARLGLRAGEVIRIQLDDIDWHQGCLKVRGKGGRSDQLPLPTDVAQAIARYIRQDRPRCACRALFIRSYAPIEGFRRAGAIATIVFDALKAAGIKAAHAGAHLLRHSLATAMLGCGASFDEIGEILRHRCIDTTAIYAKVDFNALRPLALPWPGGAQ